MVEPLTALAVHFLRYHIRHRTIVTQIPIKIR